MRTSDPTAPFALPAHPTEVEIVAKYFRAFGDPTRLRILDLLRHGEMSVTAIVEAVGAAQPRVSNHLACLRWCGFVGARREHRLVYYRLVDDRVASMLDLAKAMLADNAEHVATCRALDDAS